MRFFTSTILTLLLLPTVALANTVERLTSIPFVNSDSLGGVVTGLFYLAIVIAGMLAVVKLVIAGAKYMMSDVVTTKQSAIGDIKGAIIGLLLILGTVVILDTINDQITNANLDLPELSLEGGGFGMDDDDACEGIDECEIQTCPFVRWEFSCSSWCENQGGNFVPGGGWDAHRCAISGLDEIVQDTRTILEAAEEDIEGYEEGDSLQVCSQQGGPTMCQATREACTSGRMSTSGERGTASITSVDGVGQIVVCNF